MAASEQVNTLVGTRALAKALGVSPSSVTKAVAQNRIVPAIRDAKGRAKFVIADARRQWLANTAPLDSTGRHGIKTEDEGGEGKAEKNSDISRYNKARADREEAEAERALLELEKLKRTLLPADELGVAWTQLLKGASQKFSGLPVHLLSRFPGLTPEGRDYLHQRIREILDDLAAWNLES